MCAMATPLCQHTQGLHCTAALTCCMHCAGLHAQTCSIVCCILQLQHTTVVCNSCVLQLYAELHAASMTICVDCHRVFSFSSKQQIMRGRHMFLLFASYVWRRLLRAGSCMAPTCWQTAAYVCAVDRSGFYSAPRRATVQ